LSFSVYCSLLSYIGFELDFKENSQHETLCNGQQTRLKFTMGVGLNQGPKMDSSDILQEFCHYFKANPIMISKTDCNSFIYRTWLQTYPQNHITLLTTGWTVRGSNPGGAEVFPHLSRPALGPTQSPVQWVPGLSRGVKSGRDVTLTPHPLLVPLVMN